MVVSFDENMAYVIKESLKISFLEGFVDFN